MVRNKGTGCTASHAKKISEPLVVHLMKYKELIAKNKKAFTQFLSRHWVVLFISILIAVIVYFYFHSIYRRVPRCLGRLHPYFTDMDIHPVTGCPKLLANNYKLCDFYIASAFRCYLPCTQRYDYGSREMVEAAMIGGARALEFDIYNKNFCHDTTPVITNGKEIGNWHYTTPLSFDDICQTIAYVGYSGMLKNSSDPLFIILNFYVDNNTLTLDKVAKTIQHHFGDRLLDINYSHQKTNLAMVPLTDLLNKIIIIADEPCPDSKLNEYINYTWKQPFMRSYSHIDIIDLHEPPEVTEYNKKNLTRVFPQFITRKTQNYNPRPSWMYGCQFVSMNYSTPDENLIIYLKKFRKCSFQLKPYKLRFHPNYYKSPTPQTKKVSFAPQQISTPYYSITY